MEDAESAAFYSLLTHGGNQGLERARAQPKVTQLQVEELRQTSIICIQDHVYPLCDRVPRAYEIFKTWKKGLVPTYEKKTSKYT